MATMKDITIDVTYAELTALIAVNGLFQGVNYLITDRGDRGLLFKAASTSQLEIQGTRYMLCPATYAIGADAHGNNWIGVWNSAKTAVLNDLTIWNGQVWKCILAVTEPLTAPDVNAVNWVLITKASFTNYEYTQMIFTVSYDLSNDWICKQSDLNGNEVGVDYRTEQGDNGFGSNLCDVTDWNMNTISAEFNFSNNKCAGITNNESTAGIYNNYIPGYISRNVISGFIRGNRNNGSIANVSAQAVLNNTNNGNINSINSTNEISNNINNGSITGTFSEAVSDAIVDKTGI